MVVLTIVAPSNESTVYFDQPINKNYVRLLSCSLYNSWFNLKTEEKLMSPEMCQLKFPFFQAITLSRSWQKNLKIHSQTQFSVKSRHKYIFWSNDHLQSNQQENLSRP